MAAPVDLAHPTASVGEVVSRREATSTDPAGAAGHLRYPWRPTAPVRLSWRDYGPTGATRRTGSGKTIRQPGVLAGVHARRRGHGLGHGGRVAIIAATTP